MSTHYKTLSVTPKATQLEIAAAYKALAVKHHPDKGGDHQVFCEITNAWAVLKDPASHAAYNELLELTRPRCTACKGEGLVYKTIGFTQRSASECPVCRGEGYGLPNSRVVRIKNIL
jgi:DnaJ-class molecular chaperone